MNSLFTKRQLGALSGIPTVFKKIFKSVFKADFAAVTALLTVLVQLFGAFVNDTPVTPYGDEIDMSRFELVWEDEFDNGFDTTRWQGHYVYGADDTQLRDVAYWNRDQVTFSEDGCLEINIEYKEGPGGEAYYSYGCCDGASKDDLDPSSLHGHTNYKGNDNQIIRISVITAPTK